MRPTKCCAGFIDDVETILSKHRIAAVLFSATMPAQIKRVADKYLGDAQQVSIAAKTKPLSVSTSPT